MNKTALAGVGLVLGLPTLLLYSAFANGYVLYKAWFWLMPVIAPSITFILTFKAAVAVNLLIGIVKSNGVEADRYVGDVPIKKKTDATHWVAVIIAPWLVLLIVYIYHICL